MYLKVIHSKNENLIFKIKSYKFIKGSNIIIQRLMIQNNRLDSLTLFTFDSEINPCLVRYVKRNLILIL